MGRPNRSSAIHIHVGRICDEVLLHAVALGGQMPATFIGQRGRTRRAPLHQDRRDLQGIVPSKMRGSRTAQSTSSAVARLTTMEHCGRTSTAIDRRSGLKSPPGHVLRLGIRWIGRATPLGPGAGVGPVSSNFLGQVDARRSWTSSSSANAAKRLDPVDVQDPRLVCRGVHVGRGRGSTVSAARTSQGALPLLRASPTGPRQPVTEAASWTGDDQFRMTPPSAIAAVKVGGS